MLAQMYFPFFNQIIGESVIMQYAASLITQTLNTQSAQCHRGISQLILPRLRSSLISACSFNMHANMHQANFLVTQRSDDDFLCETLSLINIKVIFKPFFQTMTLQSLPRNWSKYLMFILLWIAHFESVKSKNSFQTNPELA